MIKRLILTAILLTSALSVFSTAAFAETTGVIQGEIVNGTAGAGKMGELEVSLTTYAGGQEKGTASAKSDADGKFQFSGISTSTSNGYVIKVNYLEVDYTSETVTFAEGEDTKSVTVNVYETTPTAENIKAHLSQIELYFIHGQLQVLDYNILTNPGDRTYVGSKIVRDDGAKETAKFTLLKGAKTGTIDYPSMKGQEFMSCCAVLTNDGFLVDTMSFIPGTKELSFVYDAEYSGPVYTLSKALAYDADTVRVWVLGAEGARGASDLLQVVDSGTDDQNLPYTVYEAQNVPAGANISLALSGLPEPGKDPQAAQNAWKWALIPLAMVVLGSAAGYTLYRRRQPVAVRSSTSLADRRENLLQEIAQLDDDFDAGRIPQEEYQRTRAAKKAQLLKITGQRRDKS